MVASRNTMLIIVLVIIAIIVGFLMLVIFSQKTLGRPLRPECPGRCYKLNPPSGAPAGIYSDQACNAEFEIRMSGASIPRNLPKTDNLPPWRCDECCLLTG